MTNVMYVDLVDSESRLFAGDAEYLVANAYDGEIGIYPNHVALITKLKPGVLRIKLPDKEEQSVFAISGGFLEVCSNRVTVLADIIERTEALDEARLVEQKEDALNKLNRSDSTMSYDLAKVQASLDIAIAQLKALDFLKKRSRQING
ncbi:MAG: ATP synthase F1 subunit epsilon [Proteobacteria bacterium]|jgi:F-type H+-transporting ATPase subunit epsilon|nr:ATP synthase F1 subunit epsilon [Pseudomonadota bacterium]